MTIDPDPAAVARNCFVNVKEKVERDGGRIVYGWTIWEYPGVFIEAEHHAIHRDGEDRLRDITPADPGEGHQRLFLRDDTHPFDFERPWAHLDNVRQALSKDPLIDRLFELSAERHKLFASLGAVGLVQLPDDVADQLMHIGAKHDQALFDIGMKYTGVNDPCFCGSGRKFKKCCRDRS
ncbi:YecA family protein [Acuticoccus kandeliae]|uniref:YecA family protein n=1 Tax=Acuticoccus kandeliae TaxID=2073160 RepID=UPI00130072DA|nr:SEC-C metal-binding domain-containing protein [Acuticoccus kandeliae]